MNAPGCRYPIPLAGTEDWSTLVLMLRGMALDAEMRSKEIRALDDPQEDIRRATAEATGNAYAFAALMIEMQFPTVRA